MICKVAIQCARDRLEINKPSVETINHKYSRLDTLRTRTQSTVPSLDNLNGGKLQVFAVKQINKHFIIICSMVIWISAWIITINLQGNYEPSADSSMLPLP